MEGSTTQSSPQHADTSEYRQSLTQVLMLGCGNMGGALLSQWRHVDNFAFTVISPSGLRKFPGEIRQARCAGDLQGQQFDIIVIAVKPQMICDVLPDYLEFLRPRGLCLSLAAGFSCEGLKTLTDNRLVARVMPNLPVAMGKGVSGLYAPPDLAPQHRVLIDRLMASTGHTLWVSQEDALDRVTAIAGSGPGYAFEFARSWAQAAEDFGFSPSQSQALVLKTLQGAVEMAMNSDASLDELRNRVTSKNGTTDAGLRALNGDHQLEALLSNTLQAAYTRALELR